MITRPAVACGTNTESSPSPSPSTNAAQADVRSNSPGSEPVRTLSSTVFRGSGEDRAERVPDPAQAAHRRRALVAQRLAGRDRASAPLEQPDRRRVAGVE